MIALEANWRTQWEAHGDLFVVSNWLERTQDRQVKWPLPSAFKYFSGGDMKLRAGIIVKTRADQEEEFLKAGLLWAAQLANGARTVMYFVAPQFSERFLSLMDTFGGKLMCKAIYWRERMAPSLFLASGGGTPAQVKIERTDWKMWERQFNPVDASYLKVLRSYFEGLAPLGGRVVFKRNKITLCRGLLEIAQIKKAGGKLDFCTTAKWLGRVTAEKHHVAGWVDVERCINVEFRAAAEEVLRLIGERFDGDVLDAKELLSLLLWENPAQAGEMWGRCVDLPCMAVDNKYLEMNKIFFMADTRKEGADEIRDLHVIVPILDKPLDRVGMAVWWRGLVRDFIKKLPQYRWDGRVNFLLSPSCQEELRIALEWIRERENFPCFILDRGWKADKALALRPMSF